MAGLRVGAIDFLNRTVTVESQLTRGLKGRMVTGSPKWNSTRTMAAPEVLLEQLATHLRRRGMTGAEGDSLVFRAPDGQPLHYSNWRPRIWVPACQSAGLDGFRFKMLRTANATVMVACRPGWVTAGRPRRWTSMPSQPRQPTGEPQRRSGTTFLAHRRPKSHPRALRQTHRAQRAAMNARWMPSGDPNGHPGETEETASDQGDDVGGASKNRTCDLSIISAAL